MSESYWTDRVALVYRELEEELIEIVIKRLKKGTNNKKDLTQWQFEKLQDLGLINAQTIKKIAEASKRTEKEVSEAFQVGPNEVIQQVDKASQKPRKVPKTNIDQIIKGYANQAKTQLNMTGEGMGLWTYGSQDMIQKYRRVIERTASFVNTGIHTLEQAVQRASQEILTEGLKTTMYDKNGRQIALDSYVRTVMKTNLARTYDEVRKEHMEDYGMHHVVVGSLVGAREACSKIQGQVVDLRPVEEVPEGSEYRSIYDPYWEAHYKEAGGHHGVNCRHPHFPFIPGVNTNNQPQYDEELNRQVSEDQQKQRSLERQIREYKKHLKVAQEFGNQKDIDRYTKLIRGRQKALRDHLDGHKYLSRDYNRERAFDFSSSPPKDIIVPEVSETVGSILPRTMESATNNAEEKLNELLSRKDIDIAKETNDKFKDTMLKMFEENHLGTRVPDLDILDSILDSHFKNQMETGSQEGMNINSIREKVTSNLFGISPEDVSKLKPKDFEKYGYLVSKDIESEVKGYNVAGRFGEVVVTFKKESIAEKTTFTMGDSLRRSEGFVGTPIKEPSLAAYEEYELRLMGGNVNQGINELSNSLNKDIDQPLKAMNNNGMEYVELQYHGEVGPNDIESVTYSRKLMEEVHGKEYVDSIKSKLDKLGIKLNEVGD